jgi:splicing factor 1
LLAPKEEFADDGSRRRKKRNRWGDATENKAAGLMGLPTAIMANMTSEQLEAYTLHLRIEEISQKLRIDDVVPADGDRYVIPFGSHVPMLTDTRSPSPAPQYDNFGRRVNTREYRYRKRLEDERHKLIEKAMKVIPNYHPPQDYRRPTKTQEKVYVPVNDYPEINFSMIANPLTLLTYTSNTPIFIYRVTLRSLLQMLLVVITNLSLTIFAISF